MDTLFWYITLYMLNFVANTQIYVFAFCIITSHANRSGGWNPSWWTRASLFCIIYTMAVDALAKQYYWTCFPGTWWRHQMKTFSALLALFAGNSLVTGIYPHKGQSRGALTFSLICAWINGWINNGGAGDLRPHRAHYDVIVMIYRHQ